MSVNWYLLGTSDGGQHGGGDVHPPRPSIVELETAAPQHHELSRTVWTHNALHVQRIITNYICKSCRKSLRRPRSGCSTSTRRPHRSRRTHRSPKNQRVPPTAEEMDTLKLKKAWEVAIAPAKQLPMNAFGASSHVGSRVPPQANQHQACT
jgi:hypothetical protein